MTQSPHKPPSEELIKFYAPLHLKRQLQELAASRNIALSALLRLLVSEYIKVPPLQTRNLPIGDRITDERQFFSIR